MRKISVREVALDAILIFGGSLLFAFGLDCFEVPNGLAAGGITGLATVFHALALQAGVNLPVGIQSIVMNVLLFAYVVRSGSKRYAALTAAGIIVSGVLTDAIAPFVPILGEGDLLLCALWGGVITGVGLGMVFRTGGNTGGTDIIAQLIARKTGASVGSMAIVVDGAIIALSAPVFSIENALYAAIAMYICGRVIDAVVDGPRVQPTSSPRSTRESPARSWSSSTAAARSSRHAACGAANSDPSSSACSLVESWRTSRR